MISKSQEEEPLGSSSDMALLAALHLDRQFGEAADWAVLHGLRLVIAGRLVHVDHLLINDALECTCIDSRYLTRALVPLTGGGGEVGAGAEGGFRLRRGGAQTRIGSPLGRTARQARLIAGQVDQRDWRTRRLPSRLAHRLGLGPRVSVDSLVLHDPNGLNEAERDRLTLHPRVRGTEALHALLQRHRRQRGRRAFVRVPATRLHALARALARQHSPANASGTPGIPGAPPLSSTGPAGPTGPTGPIGPTGPTGGRCAAEPVRIAF